MTRDYLSTLGDEGDSAALLKDDYEVVVAEARAIEGKETMFLDLQVTSGPDEGTVTSVSLYFPPDENRKAQFFFRKKARGFAAALAEVPDDLEGDEEMEAIAEALEGARAIATLGIQTKGDYKGAQELLATRPIGETDEDSAAEEDEDEAGDEEPEEKPAKPEPKPKPKREKGTVAF